MAVDPTRSSTTTGTAGTSGMGSGTSAGSDGTSSSGMPAAATAAAEKAKGVAVSQLSSQKGRAADAVSNMADTLRQAGQAVAQSQPSVPVHQYVNRAADQLEQLGSFLNENEVEDILGEVEGFARRQPMVFLGAAFAAGLVASRFLKSSSRGRMFASDTMMGSGSMSSGMGSTAGAGMGSGMGSTTGSETGSMYGSDHVRTEPVSGTY